MTMIQLPKNEAQLVVDIVQRYWATCSIFAFGYQNSSATHNKLFNSSSSESVDCPHLYLLVFTRDVAPGCASNMANTIVEVSTHTINVTLLVHHPKDLATKHPSQLYFFDTVLRQGERLCLDKTAPPILLHKAPNEKDRAEDMQFWLKCEAVALFNIQAAKESPQLEVERCKIALLHTACVQIALGLIRVRLGYIPNEFGLNYLLQLCGYFMPLSFPVFKKGTAELSRRYKLLCAPPNMLYHWTKLNASEDDFNFLLVLTQDFLNEARLLVHANDACGYKNYLLT